MKTEIVKLTRGKIEIVRAGEHFAISGEGMGGDDRSIDYVLYLNGVVNLTTGEAINPPQSVPIVGDLKAALEARGWRVEIEP